MRPVVIAAAITGSVPRKKDNPAVPITPSEQIESTHEAYEAGASLVHIHVRNDDEAPSSDPDRFATVQSRGRHNPRAVKRKMGNFPTKARAAPIPHQVFRYVDHIRVVAPPVPAPPARRAPPQRRLPAKRRSPDAAAKPRCPPGLEHVRAWQASGLSRTAYCDRHGLNPRTFHCWVALSRQALRRKAPTPA